MAWSMEKDIRLDLVMEEMRKSKPRRIEDNRILRILVSFPEGLTAKAIAAGIQSNENTTRVLLSRLKKAGKVYNPTIGLWVRRESDGTKDIKPACLTCGGRRWVGVTTDDGVKYKWCPDCQKSTSGPKTS